MARSRKTLRWIAPGTAPGAILFALLQMTCAPNAAESRRVLAEVAMADIHCALIKSGTGKSLRLSGEVSTQPPVAGAYEFTVRRKSPGGVSNVRQGGKLSAGAGEAVSVGMFGTNDDPGSVYVLSLIVTVDGEEKCRVTYEGPAAAGREG